MRIDFTCKRGEGAEPLNKGKAVCHQRAGGPSHAGWITTPGEGGRETPRDGDVIESGERGEASGARLGEFLALSCRCV